MDGIDRFQWFLQIYVYQIKIWTEIQLLKCKPNAITGRVGVENAVHQASLK